MKILYYDTWRDLPTPVPYQGCVLLRVAGACTPGDQGYIRAAIPRAELFADIVKRSGRTIKRAYRYVKVIGPVRTLAKIRSNVLAHQSRLLDTMAAVSGVLEDVAPGLPFGVGDLVAGYRQGFPLFADALVMHPDQIAPVPPGLSQEDAATVVFYSLALEGLRRIIRDTPEGTPVLVLGNGLHCRLVSRFLIEAGREIVSQATSRELDGQVSSCLRKGGAVVVGGQRWFETTVRHHRPGSFYYLGLAPDRLQPKEWTGLHDSWIGLPHSSVHNVNIFSMVPLELPGYLNSAGLREAFRDMLARSWKPGSRLTPWSVADAVEGTTVSLGTAFHFMGKPKGEMTEQPFVERKGQALAKASALRVGVVGLGLWARGNFIPLMIKDPRVRLVAGADRDPVRLLQSTDLFQIETLFSDPFELCRSDKVDAIFITTWHDTHAQFAAAAIDAGKKVFVEKPPALNYEQLSLLAASLRKSPDSFLAIGYNRPHSSLTKMLKPEVMKCKGPVTITAIVREPTIPKTHYYYWPQQGSRVASNSCHWIDYAFYLLLPRIPVDIRAVPVLAVDGQDNNVIIMRYGDGSLVSLTFANRGEALINGDEYIDIKIAGVQYMIHDFKSCLRYQEGKIEKIWQSKADRGWVHEVRDVVDGMIAGHTPRDYQDILTSAVLVIEARISYEHGGEVRPITKELLDRYKSHTQ